MDDRLVDEVPYGHWKTTTLIAALRFGGIRCATLVDGAVEADLFEAFAQQALVPQPRSGDVLWRAMPNRAQSHLRHR